MSERRALYMTVVGATAMAALGLGFSALSGSDAVLLDGAYSLITSVLGAATIIVFGRIQSMQETRRFQFGYYAFEPFINLLKSALIIAVSVAAAVFSIEELLSGGSRIDLSYALTYAVISTATAGFMYFMLRSINRKERSSLIEVDVSNWLIDTAISGALLVSFAISFALHGYGFTEAEHYVDPLIVLFLVCALIILPVRLLKYNLLQMLLSSPPEGEVRHLEEKVASAAAGMSPEEVTTRIFKQGRLTYAIVHVLLPQGPHAYSLEEIDAMRRRLAESVSDKNTTVDVMFTQNRNSARTPKGS